MSSRVEIAYCGEGPTDAAVARRLILAAGAVPGYDYLTGRPGRGKSSIDSRLSGFNVLARRQPVLVLRDLDTDAACPGALVQSLVPRREASLLLRIAVRSIEAWLMADRAAFAKAMGMREADITTSPEKLVKPKAELERLLRDSKDRSLRRRIGLDSTTGRLQPQVLAAELSEFATSDWDPARAAKSGHAPPLTRAFLRLCDLVS
ncbi:hypothetical protein [Roseicella aquatilis]|uniref:DUF4276 family protein n=1 Tax=Roseicella aquatilis TaxID=2527868 RepID=A0A4R4DKF4_9PROT|nr:hypothetical protein [Roseicella aquatilis]TCZ61280.1 hypothetical protein EXY23_12090 [Roseicella aquatilis]